MTSTRDKILQTLLTHQQCTINDLAKVVGINPISVRHHIIKLQAAGLVTSEEERHGVGRPRRVYFLTEDGVEKFPTRYLRLTNRLLEQIKSQLPEPSINELFEKMGEEMARGFTDKSKVNGLSLEKRLDYLKNLLEKEGFSVEWEQKGEEYHIKEMNCPYYHIGQQHPEVCAVDKTLISNILEIPATKINCILHGDAHCTYVVSQTIRPSDIDTTSK